MCDYEGKARGRNPLLVPVSLFLKFCVIILLNEWKKEKIIVVMASRRSAMKELSRVTFSPDTTSGGGSPRVSLRGLQRERLNM